MDQERLEILTAYMRAQNRHADVHAVISESEDEHSAVSGLIDLLGVEEMAARAILDMQWRRFTVKNRQRLAREYAEVRARVEQADAP